MTEPLYHVVLDALSTRLSDEGSRRRAALRGLLGCPSLLGFYDTECAVRRVLSFDLRAELALYGRDYEAALAHASCAVRTVAQLALYGESADGWVATDKGVAWEGDLILRLGIDLCREKATAEQAAWCEGLAAVLRAGAVDDRAFWQFYDHHTTMDSVALPWASLLRIHDRGIARVATVLAALHIDGAIQ